MFPLNWRATSGAIYYGLILSDQDKDIRLQRITFITAGQSPRQDMIDEIVADLPEKVEVVELGALDDMPFAEIMELEPRPDETGIATSLKDGSIVAISESWLRHRILELCEGRGKSINDLTVIASTGVFDLGTTNPYVVHAQNVLDRFMESILIAGQKVGQVRPLKGQLAPGKEFGASRIKSVYGPAFSDTALIDAAKKLADCDIIVLNSVGYDGRMRELIKQESGRPVVQMRRIISGTLAKILKQSRKTSTSAELLEGSALSLRLEKLTKREGQVFDHLIKGLANKEIAAELGISPRTVEIHRARMLAKMGVSTGGELMRLIVRNISNARI
ncbi:AroM family protein [uncultured Sneathiella sp.]|jgi:DNA-binding CsgD family transcriptional regulator|uniref:AroM family protein n=1 Tax=uncultured Sneathiella sp. TaxID=879315 RepID=UPI0030DCA273|tara:strand:+ start:12707 stop:13702 length:996 start_codon:yes stop_codon:yes gene_type:complete